MPSALHSLVALAVQLSQITGDFDRIRVPLIQPVRLLITRFVSLAAIIPTAHG